MKNYNVFILLSLFALFILGGCSDQHLARQDAFRHWRQDKEKVKVLSTTAMIGDLVKQVGGEYVNNLVLIQGELDPHSYQLVKGDDDKLAFADLIFYNGLGLEHGPSLAYHLTHNSKAIALGDQIEHAHSNAIIYVNGQKDPHIWMDISLWSQALPFIVEALSQKDPAHAQDFQANAKQVKAEMDQAHQQVRAILQQVPSNERYLVTSHDAFNYFTRAYLADEEELKAGTWEKRFAAPEGLAPESQLSVADIRAIIDYMQQHQIRVLFPESNVSRDSINKILQAGREQGLKMHIACCPLYGDAMGPLGSDGDTYLKMIVYDANMIAKHLNFQE